MLKKTIAAILAAVLIFSFAACGKKEPSEPVDLPQKKVAILVAPEAQYPEFYRAAAELAAEYPESVIVKEYSDSRILKAGNPEIMTLSQELAEDSGIGAIIYAGATQYTSLAISAAKKINSSLVTLCIEPEESLDTVSDLSDLVFCANRKALANDIISNAKEAGAEYFVMFSFNRHTENPLYAGAKSYFENACKENGITFVYDNSVDPIFSGGISASQLYIREAVARLIKNNTVGDKGVALFSTDSSVQSTLVTVAEERGFIYSCPAFPSAYNGVGENYEIELPEKITDTSSYIKSLSAAVSSESGATLFVYSHPLAATLLEGALISAFDMLNGKTTDDNLAERATLRLTDAADDKDFTVTADENYSNVFTAYISGFEKL